METLEQVKVGNRFSGADWADQKRDIILVGIGGIGSWTALNLSRIGHTLYLVDPDHVDETNVQGGQMFERRQIGISKVDSVFQCTRNFGCTNQMTRLNTEYNDGTGMLPIVISGLDNMKARKKVFENWKRYYSKKPDSLLIDGRLLMETMEVITLVGGRQEDLDKYEKYYLFEDEDVKDLDCTTKQTTFGAMIISGLITATLCNFLTNRKLGEEIREVPFYQRMHLPIFNYQTHESINSTESIKQVAAVSVNKD